MYKLNTYLDSVRGRKSKSEVAFGVRVTNVEIFAFKKFRYRSTITFNVVFYLDFKIKLRFTMQGVVKEI
jgi:hypothetical protein